MNALRIRAGRDASAERCSWLLAPERGAPVAGEGRLAEAPLHAARVQLVLPAADVLLVSARLPASARRSAGPLLQYAVEDRIAVEADRCEVHWLGKSGDDDVLAVIDGELMRRWREWLDGAGIRSREFHCETLMLPLAAGGWTLSWDGREGHVRSGRHTGAATDCGDRDTPPLSLQQLVDAGPPAAITVHATADAMPDLAAWQRRLGVPLRPAAAWSWRTATPAAESRIAGEQRRWPGGGDMLKKLRPAAVIAAAALAVHTAASVVDWALLVRERQALQQQMEARFRELFPEALAVADPALQMRRKLAEARHAAGLLDDRDFIAMADRAAASLRTLPAGSVRGMAYEGGNLTVEVAATGDAALAQLLQRLRAAGLQADRGVPAASTAAQTFRIVLKPS